jgi:hypothetical protein
MPALHDLRCDRGHELRDVEVSAGCYPPCSICQTPMRPDFSRWTTVKTDIWGQSRYFVGLDREFSNVGELRAYCRAEGIMPAGDRVRGARTEPFQPRIYSGLGISPRASARRADVERRLEAGRRAGT